MSKFRHIVAALLLLSVAAACGDETHSRNELYGGLGSERFQLVIEADRTDVDASHFLVDRATGDLWKLEGGRSGTGRWTRIASGPQDASELELPAFLSQDEEDD